MVKAYCSFRQVPSAAKSLSLFAGFTLFNRIGKSGAEIFSPTPLYCFFYFCMLLFLYLHRLVGLRLLRLCLKLRQGFALYPQGTLSLDPASPLTPGLSLRFISRYARCWGHNFGQLCSFLTPHSSLLTYLTPHLLRHCFFHFLYKLSEHCKCFINRLSCCHIYSCTLKQ